MTLTDEQENIKVISILYWYTITKSTRQSLQQQMSQKTPNIIGRGTCIISVLMYIFMH